MYIIQQKHIKAGWDGMGIGAGLVESGMMKGRRIGALGEWGRDHNEHF